MRAMLFAAAASAGWLVAVSSEYRRNTEADPAEPMIVHNVYFSLAEGGRESRTKLIESCRKYLSEHPGVVYFAAGLRATDFEREVNDQDFDVALHLVFKDKAAHDEYQASEKHKQFITEVSSGLKKVRVFDSKVKNSKFVK